MCDSGRPLKKLQSLNSKVGKKHFVPMNNIPPSGPINRTASLILLSDPLHVNAMRPLLYICCYLSARWRPSKREGRQRWAQSAPGKRSQLFGLRCRTDAVRCRAHIDFDPGQARPLSFLFASFTQHAGFAFFNFFYSFLLHICRSFDTPNAGVGYRIHSNHHYTWL